MDGNKIISEIKGSSGQKIELPIANPKLWSQGSPFLYDLKVALLEGEKIIDTVDSYLGMRKVEVKKDASGFNRLYLNNKALFQYGPLDQGWWPDGLYTPPTEEAIKFDISTTKKFGMNMARKHVKYETALWYYWCDKLGLLVWQDMPSGDSGRDDQSKENFAKELQAMIDALHNFPCIVMWVPFNEGWGQHDTAKITKWIQEYDPTRPVNEASGWTDRGSGDISDIHKYPGPATRPAEDKRACVLGEFGGLGLPIKGHLWQEDRNWGYVSYKNTDELTNAYINLLTKIPPLISIGLSAAVYTQTSDVEIEVNGLLTYDRKVIKMNTERCAQAAKKLYQPPPTVKTILETSRKKKQQWSYTIDEPSADWFLPSFEDSSWKKGPGGFGTPQTPGALVGTLWNSSDIWLRRNFELAELPEEGNLALLIHHDEDAQIYINGRSITELAGYVTEYTPIILSADAVENLRTGKNTIAVHCHQTQGGQFIDVGLMIISD